MDDVRVGASMRAVRMRLALRQTDVAARVGVSRATVARLERGALDQVSLRALRRVGVALGMTLDIVPRWRGGDLDRLLHRRHGFLHESLAAQFAHRPEWGLEPEVSYDVRGERGIIDGLAWHAASRSLLLIELKSDLVDVSAVLGQLSRYLRVAPAVAASRRWTPATISVWLILADTRTNRRRTALHRAALRNALPLDGRAMRSWLSSPEGAVRVLSFLPYAHRATLGHSPTAVHRVGHARQTRASRP